ncbi:hypothetical protein niasHS_001566 [Heterodera schachtii]|uniref:Uncharacterized protein n=1 Tax=Heterodera schachtii TaxID=97005 RepID=A0ABD2KE02_HETSC
MAQFSLRSLALLGALTILATFFTRSTLGEWPGNTVSEKIDLLIAVYPQTTISKVMGYCKEQKEKCEKEWKRSKSSKAEEKIIEKLKKLWHADEENMKKNKEAKEFKNKMKNELFAKTGPEVISKYIGPFTKCVFDSYRLKSFWQSTLLNLLMLERNGGKSTGGGRTETGTQMDNKMETNTNRTDKQTDLGTNSDMPNSDKWAKTNANKQSDFGTNSDMPNSDNKQKSKLGSPDKTAQTKSKQTTEESAADETDEGNLGTLDKVNEASKSGGKNYVKEPSQKRARNRSTMEELRKRHSALLTRSNSGRSNSGRFSSRPNSVDYSQGYVSLKDEMVEMGDPPVTQPSAAVAIKVEDEAETEAALGKKTPENFDNTLAFGEEALEMVELQSLSTLPELFSPKLESLLWDNKYNAADANALLSLPDDMKLYSEDADMAQKDTTAQEMLKMADTFLEDLNFKMNNKVEAFSQLYYTNNAYKNVFDLPEDQVKLLERLLEFDLSKRMKETSKKITKGNGKGKEKATSGQKAENEPKTL